MAISGEAIGTVSVSRLVTSMAIADPAVSQQLNHDRRRQELRESVEDTQL